jgi:hypothetical protein
MNKLVSVFFSELSEDPNMLERIPKLFTAAICVIVLSLSFSGCQSPPSTTKPATTVTTTSTISTTTTLANPDMIEVVSVRGPLAPINPGGPNVEITIKNVTILPVTGVSATLELNTAFNFTFDISPANPLLPDQTISSRLTLIGAGFNSTSSYSMVIDGVLQDGEIFSLNKQVQITP